MQRLWVFLTIFVIPIFPIKRDVFYEKLNESEPLWVREQIEEDLGFFRVNGITQQAIEHTLEQATQLVLSNLNLPPQPIYFARYRIFNNHIYRKKETGYHVYLDQVLFNLSKMIKLPDVDFIVCLYDGLPDHYAKKNYWITDHISDQAPLFCRGKKTWAKYAVLVPDYSVFDIKLDIQSTSDLIDEVLSANKMYPWGSKTKQAYWRGGPSDFWENPNGIYSTEAMKSLYSVRPRFALCVQSRTYPNLIDAGFVPYPDPQIGLNGNLESWFYEEKLMKERSSKSDHIAFAYLPCMDGWMGTYPGYYWRLLSNSVIFKPDSDHQLWFYKALKPFEHYIPLNYDCDDIIAKIEWAKNNDLLCKSISQESTQLVIDELSVEDNYLYVFRVLKFYEKLQRFNLRNLIRSTKYNDEWIKIESFRWE